MGGATAAKTSSKRVANLSCQRQHSIDADHKVSMRTMQGVGRRFRVYEMCTVKALQVAAERHLSVNHRLHKSRLAVKIAVRTSNKYRPDKHDNHLDAPLNIDLTVAGCKNYDHFGSVVHGFHCLVF
jgi:hypothetical protein